MSEQDPKAAEAQAAQTPETPVAASNGRPEAIPYDRFQEVNRERRAFAEENALLKARLALADQQASQSYQPQAQAPAVDDDTKWLRSTVEEALDAKLGPVNQRLGLMEAQTQYAQWEAQAARTVNPDIREQVRQEYMNRVAVDPALSRQLRVQDVAYWKMGQLAHEEAQTRADLARWQQGQTTSTPPPGQVGESRPQLSPEEPVDKTSIDYIRRDDVNLEDIYADITASGFDIQQKD